MKYVQPPIVIALLCLAGTLAPAQQGNPTSDQGAQKSAEDVLNDLLQKRVENPLIEPARPIQPPAIDMTLSDRAKPKPAIGTRPNAAPVRLLREGQFIVNRRARILPSDDQGATGWMVTFDSDDPPMLLMPCQMLEDAEAVAKAQGDAATFVVSGQVFVYHNANYLLPTVVKQVSRRQP